MLIFFGVVSACVSVCVRTLRHTVDYFFFFFSSLPPEINAHQASWVWWDIILGCFPADGGGLQEDVKSSDGRKEVLCDALRPITRRLTRGISAEEVSAGWHLWNNSGDGPAITTARATFMGGVRIANKLPRQSTQRYKVGFTFMKL